MELETNLPQDCTEKEFPLSVRMGFLPSRGGYQLRAMKAFHWPLLGTMHNKPLTITLVKRDLIPSQTPKTHSSCTGFGSFWYPTSHAHVLKEPGNKKKKELKQMLSIKKVLSLIIRVQRIQILIKLLV